MEELHAAAYGYYNHGNEYARRVAYDFFRSMDTDGDGKITWPEFKAFVQQSGYDWILHNDPQNMFAKLDRNRDGHLDFEEVLTLYYIIKTGYITCRSCQTHLCGLYFTCVGCFDGGAANYHHHYHYATYDLCATCYGSRNYSHQHSYFLDNHVLLRSKRGPHAPPNLAMAVAPPNPLVINNYYGNPAAPAPATQNGWFHAFQAFETALSVSNLVSNCTIL